MAQYVIFDREGNHYGYYDSVEELVEELCEINDHYPESLKDLYVDPLDQERVEPIPLSVATFLERFSPPDPT